MFSPASTQGHVLCCLCGESIKPNPSNMCLNCIRGQIDVTEGIQKQLTVLFCRECGRYLTPPKAWVKAELESKELLTFCIKRINGLSKVKLVDAGFVWTEPHSKRIKVKLTVQKEVFNGAILQQSFVSTFVVEDHMCDGCARLAANPNQWVAVVQVRQKVEHKRTFFFLEQLILKHSAAEAAILIKEVHDGMDFFFAKRSPALKFLAFLGAVVPIRSRADKQLVSQDQSSNTYNYKYTFSVEMVPVCKDDAIYLPDKLARAAGGVGPVLVCSRVSTALALTDPLTLRVTHLDAGGYFNNPFPAMLSAKQLTEYTVLDVEPIAAPGVALGAASDGASVVGANHHNLQSDISLKAGDTALGYDMAAANVNDAALDARQARGYQLPDVVLVRKSYDEKRRRKRARGKSGRAWKLNRLPMESDVQRTRAEEDRLAADEERFMEELEEDPDLRARVALYRQPGAGGGDADQGVAAAAPAGAAPEDGTGEDDDSEGPPEVPLAELLAGLEGLRLGPRVTDEAEGGDDEPGDDEDAAMDN